MTEQRENTKRIAKNTLMLYIRMMFGMLVSLYTSRVILQALGVEDYGIYNVVGGFVAMFFYDLKYFSKECFRRMSSFATWNFIGCTAGLLKGHGVNILLNIFFDPVLNTVRGIASTVNNAISSYVNNFMTVLNSQITKSYEYEDYDYMNSLVERGSRFSFYITFIFILLVMLETEFILNLWLGSY